jgi:hypothetical protein
MFTQFHKENPMSNNANDIRTALARAVAQRQVPDDTIDKMASQIAGARFPIRKIDICTMGICIDYFLEGDQWWTKLPELINIEGGELQGIEIFPYGIPFPDLHHVRVIQRFGAVPGLGG